ncbi:tetratricopeptide repeat protein [Aquimarina longa]|uniref:tetratricopeptide repeat protein n=1 Tax=Aquimarina longa TaxID=1080221 RepID=UPI000780F357|nr:tetratricopeptide repeat protein [Aquimarina longa]
MKTKDFLINYEEILEKVNSQKIIISIIIISLLVFSPVFTSSEFLTYDDNWYIYENENVTNLSWQSIKNIFTTLQGGQYSPLGEVYHSFLYYFFGENATAFKISALFVHLLNVFLLFKIFDSVFQKRLLVVIVVLFFAIHPMQVETIGWISVIFRNAVFFMFLGYLFYLKYLDNNFGKYRLIPVLVCYILAFLTKEQAILFPVGLFLIHMMKSDSIMNRKFIIEMIFWAIIALIFGLITIEVTKTGGPSIIDRNVSLYDKVGLLAKTILSYGYNFLFPFELSFSYPYPSAGSKTSFLTILITIGFLILGGYIAFKNKIVRFGFLWLFGFLSLGLAFAFFHLRDTYMADRYTYVAVIGFSVILYQFLFYLKKVFINKVGFLISFLLFIFSFSIISFNRVTVFKNNGNLWTQVLEVNPDNAYAYNSLGFYYRNLGKIDTAYTLYKKALKIDPKYYLAHSNITKVYYERKQYDSALYHISKAISINPYYEQAYENRAFLHFITDKKDLYLADLNKLLVMSPNNVKYLNERAQFYFKQRQYNETIKDALRIIEVSNNKPSSDIFYLLGHSYLVMKKYKKAEKYLSKAIDMDDEKSKYYFSRSIARVSTNKWKFALKDALQAKKLGYKVKQEYISMLIREVKKKNN